MIKKFLAKKSRQWKKIKFSKKIVVSCILLIVLYTITQLYMSFSMGLELSPTLTTCVYAFFGTELAACALVRIFDRESREEEKKANKNKKDKESVG